MNTPPINAIIQARMGSSRLPGKSLALLSGKPVLGHIIDRISHSKYIHKTIVATTTHEIDDRIIDYIQTSSSASYFRGSEANVLERFHKCALAFPCDYIVRVTADDPLKDPQIIDQAIAILLENPKLDYCSNTTTPTYPEGLCIEVFKQSALAKAFSEAKLDSEREHVTPYIWNHPEIFNTHCFKYSEDLSHWRWTLDKPEDLEFFKVIFSNFFHGESFFPYQKIVEFIKANPHIAEINAGIVRNEGYLKSVKAELS